MQPIIEENTSVASVGKTNVSLRWGHPEFESRNVKFLTRIYRQNKRYTNIDLAIPFGYPLSDSDPSSGNAWFKSLRSRVFSTANITFFPILISSTFPTI